jgi:DHA2 family multidrug resistance protein
MPAHAAGSAVAQLTELAERISQQAFVLSIADGYMILGALAVVLIPFVLNLQYIKPPILNTTSK